MRVILDFEEKTIDEIIRQYHLNILTPQGVVRENIAVAIKHLYFYAGLSRCEIKNEEKMLYRQMIILSYSAIEAIIISIAYRIQTNCRGCNKCLNRDVSLFQADEETNKRTAFYNADKFLRKIGILDLERSDLDFYSSYRHLRNEIHLIESSQILTNPHYTDEFCKESINFLKRFFKQLKENYLKYVDEYCKKEEDYMR